MNLKSKRPFQNLADSIHSLLGINSSFTSVWVDSVQNIIRNAPSEGSSDDSSLTSVSCTCSSTENNVDSDVLKMKDKLAALTVCINKINAQRRHLLNEFLDLKGNIRVFCRVRPITLGEDSGEFLPIASINSSDVILKSTEHKSRTFSFDRVFHPGSSQDEVFSEIEPVIKSVLDGYNACIFAFGQTGSGKTFTMEGTPDSPGVVPRAIEALFHQATESNHTFHFNLSMLEMYLGNLKDLLIPQLAKVSNQLPKGLSIKTDPEGGIEIDSLVTLRVDNLKQALRLYRLGCRLRSTASTNSNRTSSRSHCMIRISVACYDPHERRRETNKLWMIDLGGSERVLKTKAQGRRFEEGKAINLSLSALGDVMNALQRKKLHIPYRNSKLTQVLKDSLGEDSKVLMLVHVSPKEEDLCESLCSLNFASRVQSIHLGNEESQESREQKEAAMSNLQHKMEQIELERQEMRKDMMKLTETLAKFTGKDQYVTEQSDASQRSMEVSSAAILKNRISNKSTSSTSALPRFMRPTVCSNRKFGTAPRCIEDKTPALARKRLNRSESVTFPLQNASGYNSGCSISRASCLMDMNTKNSLDNETECSQDISEYDMNMLVSRKQQEPPKSAHIQMSRSGHCKSSGKRNLNASGSAKSELHTDSAHRTKKILAVPAPERKVKHKKQNDSVGLRHCKKLQGYELQERQTEERDNTVDAKRPFLKMKTLLNDFDRCNSISSSLTTDTEEASQKEAYDSSITYDEDAGFLAKPCAAQDAMWYDPPDHNNQTEVHNVPKLQPATEELQASDKHCHFPSYYNDDSDVGKVLCPGISATPITELHPSIQELHSEEKLDPGEMEELCASTRGLQKETGPSELPHGSRCQRALFIDNAGHKTACRHTIDPKATTINTTGEPESAKQRIQTLYASALLALGFQNLGYEDDFYYSLLL